MSADGFILDFTLDYFCKNDNDIELIFQNGLFCHFDLNDIITISNPDIITEQLAIIEKEITEQPFQYLTSVHSRIELLLIAINRQRIADGYEIWKPSALFLKFLETVRNNFDKNYSVSQIADLLQTTDLKLNELSKTHAGKTAQNIIHGLVISEAKRLLQYENLLVKEVAAQLGFDDVFYFSKFFKKQEGISPKDFSATVSVKSTFFS